MAKAEPLADADTVARYKALIATIPEIEVKGAKNLYTSINGNMFTTLTPEGDVGIRLPKDQRDRFLADHDEQLLHTYGAVLKEYVTVPAHLLVRTDDLAPVLALSWQYAQGLPPKPTRRKKSS
jgi:hypothetical protein